MKSQPVALHPGLNVLRVPCTIVALSVEKSRVEISALESHSVDSTGEISDVHFPEAARVHIDTLDASGERATYSFEAPGRSSLRFVADHKATHYDDHKGDVYTPAPVPFDLYSSRDFDFPPTAGQLLERERLASR